MKINFDWKKLLPYMVAIVVFIVFTVSYCAPILDGKVLQAGDVNNWKGISNEALSFKDKTGETTWWTNSQFGGMPTFQITGSTPTNTIVNKGLRAIAHFGFDEVRGNLLGYFLGFFIMLLCFGVNPWLALIGSLAISMSSYFFLIIPAGHMTKACAIGFLGALFGGFYAIFHGKRAWGFVVSTIAAIIGITLHPQMTYYVFMLIGICAIAELYIHIMERRWKDLGIGVALFALALLLTFGTKLSWWQMNQEYLAETMRGGHSELTTQKNSDEKVEKKMGLDIDYVTAWSYGIDETMTFLIPNFEGGASGYNVGEKSQLYEDLVRAGVPKQSAKSFCQSAPTYRGEKAFTSGPVYMGAIVCLLFVLGLIIVPGPYKWALLIATIFSVLLAWGRNFMPFTQFFYDYFPMYNKFRAVESILVVAEITIPLLAFLGLQQVLLPDSNGSRTGVDPGSVNSRKQPSISTALYIAGGITAGICLIVALFGGSLIDFTSSYDAAWKSQVGDRIYQMILDQRAAMLRTDAWRSFVFVVLGFVAIFAYIKGWLKRSGYLYAILGILILADMVPVNRRFFNNDNFVTAKNNNAYFAEQPWETQILADKSLDFRVLNLNANTFNDARTSYRLKSIGGYHAAKLRRYQDLIDAHISKNNWQVINMLNTKYIITRNGVQLNPQAFGNAWFVDEVQFVDTPDEESQALWNLNLRTTAVADKKFKEALNLSKYPYQTLMAIEDEGITITDYQPNHLAYQSASEHNRIAVFSEIYYPKGWHLYIDGEEHELARVNYTLRAAIIPAGIHEITMEFVPDALKTDQWSLAILILTLILCVIAITISFVSRRR